MKPATTSDPHVFLINLDRSRKRLQQMALQASRLGLAFERIPRSKVPTCLTGCDPSSIVRMQ